MNRRMRIHRGSWIGVLTCLLMVGGSALAEETYHQGSVPERHRRVAATVRNITDNDIFVNTQEDTVRNFAIRDIHREKIKSLKPGDRIVLELDLGNQIIDIEKIPNRVWVTGKVVAFDGLRKEVSIKLDDGTFQTYKMKDAAATDMNGIETNTTVSLEIDGANNLVMDFTLK